MAVCPKCGRKLRLSDWRPECPACGVNMIYYNANDRLLAETERAEIEHAKSQPRIDRAKAAFFGSPPAVARLALNVLPLAALFLPLGRLICQEYVQRVDALSVFGFLQNADVGALFGGLTKGEPLSVSLLSLLLSAVLTLAGLFCLPASLGRLGKARNLLLNGLAFCGALTAAVCFSVRGGALLPEYHASQLGWGAFVYLFLLLALLTCNLILAKKGLRVRYTTCLIGGLPADEYYGLVARGASELEIREKMVAALTEMQEEVRSKAEREREADAAKRAAWK